MTRVKLVYHHAAGNVNLWVLSVVCCACATAANAREIVIWVRKGKFCCTRRREEGKEDIHNARKGREAPPFLSSRCTHLPVATAIQVDFSAPYLLVRKSCSGETSQTKRIVKQGAAPFLTFPRFVFVPDSLFCLFFVCLLFACHSLSIARTATARDECPVDVRPAQP